LRRLAAALLVVTAVVAACGDDDEPAAGPTATATATPTATATATPNSTPTPTPSAESGGTGGATSPEGGGATGGAAAPENPEDQPGGAGDEEAARVPVEITVGADGITPRRVSVPAFLALQVVVHNERSEQVTVRLEGAEPMTVGPGATFTANLDGRRPGRYAIDAGDAGQAVLVTGVEVGP
jgi:hypothetical protein